MSINRISPPSTSASPVSFWTLINSLHGLDVICFFAPWEELVWGGKEPDRMKGKRYSTEEKNPHLTGLSNWLQVES